MPLPLSGQISARDINQEIGFIPPESVPYVQSVAGVVFELFIDPTNWSDSVPGLGMDEFYGLSLSDLTVDPTSFQFSNTGGSKVFIVTSRAGAISASADSAFLTVDNIINTSLPTASFSVDALSNSSVGAPARSGSITVSNSTTTVIVPITQNAGPTPTITINPNISEAGGLDTFFIFDVFTNAGDGNYTVQTIPSPPSTPNFVTSTSINGRDLTVFFSTNNEPGAQPREVNVVVQTNTGFQTEVQDTALLRQLSTPEESISVSGPSDIPNTGQQNVDYDVETVDEYGTIWVGSIIPLNPGDDVSWATIVSQFFDVGSSGDGTIRVNFASNPIGSPSKFAQIAATSPGVPNTNRVVQLASNTASLELTPTDDVSVDVNGNGSFTLESNTTWIISGIASRNNNLSPQGGGPGTFTINVNGTPTPVGTANVLVDDITISTTTGLSDIIITGYSLIQAANPATMEITFPLQDPFTISAFGTTNLPIILDTNASDFSITLPSFISLVPGSKDTVNKTFSVSIPQNFGTQRQGVITVETITPGNDDVSDTLTVIQDGAPTETITLDPQDIPVPYTGQNDIDIDVITEEPFFNTAWIATIDEFPEFPFANTISFEGSNQGTGDGQIRINVAQTSSTVTTYALVTVSKNPGGTPFGQARVVQAPAPNLFTYPDAGVSGFAVARNTGIVTPPQAADGTITSRDYSSGYSGGFYPLVTSNTTRSVTVTVQVPSGYDNSGGTVSGTETAIQDAADETITITANKSSLSGQGDSVEVNVTTVGVYNTSWSAVITFANPANNGWITLSGGSSGVGDGNFFIFVGANSPGSVGYTGSTREFEIRVNNNNGGNPSNLLSFSQPVYIPPTPPPTPTLNVTTSNNNICTEGSGFINLTASGGSGFFVFHIGTTPASSPAGASNTDTASNLSNGTYFVAVFDITYGTSDSDQVIIDCSPVTTTTTTTTTTQAPNSWFSERNDGDVFASIGFAQGYSENDEVLVNDGSGICWTLGTPIYDATIDYTITGPCPAPTTTTTQAPSCFAVSIVRERNAEDACCAGIVDTGYFNTNSVETATIYYGLTNCSTPFAFSQYFDIGGGQYYQWVGGVMSGPFTCPNCP